MSKKKVVILKNDRTGDLFVSLRAINKIINKHQDQSITIFLSNINHKFNFLFPTLEKIVIPMDLSIIFKIKIFVYILFNKIDTIYILSPKNFYYYLAFFFRKVRFYAITIKAKKNRPNKFLLNYLFKYVELDRINIKKRKSSYETQEKLIDGVVSKNYLKKKANTLYHFTFPKNYIFFHYKRYLFENLLGWNIQQIYSLLDFMSKRYENVLFSSEFKDEKINNYFSENFNTYNYDNGKENFFNKKNIFFLKNIDGYDLFNAVDKSVKIISPEGIITHMGYHLNKPVMALMHFNLRNRQDFINQIISCKEWFPPNNYGFIVLKKNFDKSIAKLLKRI